MPVTTTSAAVHITPVVIKTFFEHGRRKAKKIRESSEEEDARDDIFFHQAFNIVKAFIELGTQNTVESLQAFTNTHVPAPYWAAVSPVIIPLSSCNRAADILIDWFGSEELKRVVGGERWWQVRGLDGVDGEWITEKEYLDKEKPQAKLHQKLNESDANILRMEHLQTVMLYIHGGGYFWGSINTHRYQIIRYARKFKGRAFAVNYRKAPQYPWPCPLQDVLAAYIYLIHPPEDALHRPISPSKIVFAGDSAGGGLCITALTIIRDMGLPMPAGAVLISPWVDLTHSFPSIAQNTETDIIPQHGFLTKPSTLWPIDPIPPDGGRVVPSKSNPPPDPGQADTLKPSQARLNAKDMNRRDITADGERVQTQEEMLNARNKDIYTRNEGNDEGSENSTSHSKHTSSDVTIKENAEDYNIDLWEPKFPKVLMEDPGAIPLELRTQIQLYATTEQLTHPLVSPVLQGSLGNLPPIYILAGNDEVLRDEIIYIAHRAAHPEQYPTRHRILQEGKRQKENAEKFTTPTKVHLQVFDDMCHVLTVFTFTRSAKYAYRSIAEFVKHVSNHDAEHLERNPFPEFHRPPVDILTKSEAVEQQPSAVKTGVKNITRPEPLDSREVSSVFDTRLYKLNEATAEMEVKQNYTDAMPRSQHVSEEASRPVGEHKSQDISNIRMIRERVNIHGITRPMEPPGEIAALNIRPGQIGIIKEAPTIRWLKGQEYWDKRFERDAKRVLKKRSKIEAKSRKLIDNAHAQGLILTREIQRRDLHETLPRRSTTSHSAAAVIQNDRRWGPLDLDDERPPPTAIAKRRDTPEALALLKKSIYHTAPVTHGTVPKLRASDVIRAAFDPKDDPIKAPRQSVSEQQVRTHIIPVHGLRMWDGIVRYFGRKTSKKAMKSTKEIGEQLGILDHNSE